MFLFVVCVSTFAFALHIREKNVRAIETGYINNDFFKPTHVWGKSEILCNYGAWRHIRLVCLPVYHVHKTCPSIPTRWRCGSVMLSPAANQAVPEQPCWMRQTPVPLQIALNYRQSTEASAIRSWSAATIPTLAFARAFCPNFRDQPPGSWHPTTYLSNFIFFVVSSVATLGPLWRHRRNKHQSNTRSGQCSSIY